MPKHTAIPLVINCAALSGLASVEEGTAEP